MQYLFAAVGDVTTQQGGARLLRQGIQPRPDPRHAMQRGGLIARPSTARASRVFAINAL